jgi:hypothetical protein
MRGKIPSANPKAMLRVTFSTLMPSPSSIFTSLKSFFFIEGVILKDYGLIALLIQT